MDKTTYRRQVKVERSNDLGYGNIVFNRDRTLDYYLTIDISLSIFYLIPIILTTWYLEKTYGLVLVLLSTVIWFIGDSHSKQYSYGWLPYWNAGVRLGFFWSINYLLSSLKLAYEKEKYFARNDELTGAVNRRFFLELLALELQRCERYDRAFTLAYIDVDNFKLVNVPFAIIRAIDC